MSLSYQTYLRLNELLAQQVPESDPVAHDELMFIVVHQSCELWFKLLLHELTDARDQMLAGRAALAGSRLERCHVIERHLIGLLEVIDSMSPHDFHVFRGALGEASGFQSAQFREIELLSGGADGSLLGRLRGFTPAERARIARRMSEPTLWDGYVQLLSDAGLDARSDPEQAAALRTVAQGGEKYAELWRLAEAMITHDQNWYIWRSRHIVTVERQIGTKPGTGGTRTYLQSRLGVRFFPNLWALRVSL